MLAAGLTVFVIGEIAIHLAAPLAGLALVKVSAPFILPMAFVCTFVNAALHAPMLGDPLALQFGLDPKTTSAAALAVLGVAGALLIGFNVAIASIPISTLMIFDTGTKLEVTIGTFVTLGLTSTFIEFGQGLIDQGRGESTSNICYQNDIKKGIEDTYAALSNAPRQILDFFTGPAPSTAQIPEAQ